MGYSTCLDCRKRVIRFLTIGDTRLPAPIRPSEILGGPSPIGQKISDQESILTQTPHDKSRKLGERNIRNAQGIITIDKDLVDTHRLPSIVGRTLDPDIKSRMSWRPK